MNKLVNLEVLQNSLKTKDLKFALKTIKENKEDFERIWDAWFN